MTPATWNLYCVATLTPGTVDSPNYLQLHGFRQSTGRQQTHPCLCLTHVVVFPLPAQRNESTPIKRLAAFVDKTVRSYAAELWIEGLSTGRINNHRVGEILARLINMELAPLKRFTTQVYESMYKRSAFHNRQLEELLTVFISGLPDKPVTGLKQLLELYLELLTINRSKVTNEQLLQRLQEWATNSNLKKVTTSLNKL